MDTRMESFGTGLVSCGASGPLSTVIEKMITAVVNMKRSTLIVL